MVDSRVAYFCEEVFLTKQTCNSGLTLPWLFLHCIFACLCRIKSANQTQLNLGYLTLFDPLKAGISTDFQYLGAKIFFFCFSASWVPSLSDSSTSLSNLFLKSSCSTSLQHWKGDCSIWSPLWHQWSSSLSTSLWAWSGDFLWRGGFSGKGWIPVSYNHPPCHARSCRPVSCCWSLSCLPVLWGLDNAVFLVDLTLSW